MPRDRAEGRQTTISPRRGSGPCRGLREGVTDATPVAFSRRRSVRPGRGGRGVQAHPEAARAGRAERRREDGGRGLHERDHLAGEPDPRGLPRGGGPAGRRWGRRSTPRPSASSPGSRARRSGPPRTASSSGRPSASRTARPTPRASTSAPSSRPARRRSPASTSPSRPCASRSTSRSTGCMAADATDVKRQVLTGRLVTADVEDARGVEQVLRASHAGPRPAGLLGPRDEPPRPRVHGAAGSSGRRRRRSCVSPGTAAPSASTERRPARSRCPASTPSPWSRRA